MSHCLRLVSLLVCGFLAGTGIAADPAALPAAATDAVVRVTLPQDHAYQVVLRNYLAALKESDFTVPLAPVGFDEAWVKDDESLHRLWILSLAMPQTLGLTMAADNFLLAKIEHPDGIRMLNGSDPDAKDPKRAAFRTEPGDTAWWASWDYPGNPYKGSRAVRNRAFVMAAVDMIMLDHLHESGKDWVANGRRSDFLGGTLNWLAHVYREVRADLPAPVQAAYETGLAKFVGLLNEWGPTSVNDNMDMKALPALAYVIETFKEGPLVEQSRAYMTRVLPLFHPAGMIRDAGGLEASYNGIALYDLAWAAAVSKQPELLTTLRRESDLKAHLALPEPDGVNWFGPSHFNARTSADMAADQWDMPPRDIAIAMRTDEALYLMSGGRWKYGPRWAAADHEVMLKAVSSAFDRLNKNALQPSPLRFSGWKECHWGSRAASYAHDYYRKGFYQRLRDLDAAKDPLTLPPFSRPGATFVRAFPDPATKDIPAQDRDTFLVARFADYGVVIYTGPLGWSSYMNFAGGALSAFWTPTGGSMLLSRSGHGSEPETTRQTWADWKVWPTHALSGTTASGKAFSSARMGRRGAETVKYDVSAESATVTYAGPLGVKEIPIKDKSAKSAQEGCITGKVSFQRRFEVSAKGIAIETKLESDGSDQVTDLCEILPILLKDTSRQAPRWRPKDQGDVPQRVRFQVGEALVDPPAGFLDGVTAVRIDRFAGSAMIRFKAPQRVRLGETWTDNYQSGMAVRNLLIDLLGQHDKPVPLPNVTLRYRIEPIPAEKPCRQPQSCSTM